MRPASRLLTRSSTGPVAGPAGRFRWQRRWPHCGMTVLVVDASVLAVALADDGSDGDRVRARLRGQRLAAPELIDLEVASVLRGQLRAGALDARRAGFALADL